MASTEVAPNPKMDMALDDIIKKTPRRGRGRGRGGRGRGGGRGGQGNMNGHWVLGVASLGRQLGRPSLQTSGPPKLHVSNLAKSVSDADIKGLFSDFGSMRAAAIHYNKSGKSLGTADVVFQNRLDAMKAMTMLNGIPLDGKPLKISIEGGVGITGGVHTNIVNRLGGRRGFGGRGRGRGFRGGRGRRGRGGKPRSADDLDADMDSYTKSKPKTAEELDAEMDAYVEAKGKASNDE